MSHTFGPPMQTRNTFPVWPQIKLKLSCCTAQSLLQASLHEQQAHLDRVQADDSKQCQQPGCRLACLLRYGWDVCARAPVARHVLLIPGKHIIEPAATPPVAATKLTVVDLHCKCFRHTASHPVQLFA